MDAEPTGISLAPVYVCIPFVMCFQPCHVFILFQGETVDGALARMSDEGILQPTLFRVDGQYYIKLDNSALELESASCFTDALECVFMCFWIFGVEYPQELRLFYGFIEKLIQMKNGSKVKSSVLADFWRLLECARE
jgi:hypothetical protein